MRLKGSAVGEVNYTIPFSSGALRPKHVKRIGPAWALFLHYEDRVTTGKGTNGFVLGGKETTDDEPAERLGCTSKTIGRHRRRLEKHRYIHTKLTRKGYIVTVRKSVKWKQIQHAQDKIALRRDKSDPQRDKSAPRRTKNVLPGACVPINDIALTLHGHLPAEWAAFWKVYPKKKSKPDAERAWKKIKLAEVAAIIAAVEARKNTNDWMKDEGQYIPYPATFLNKRQWEDELTKVNSGQGTGKPNGSGKFAAYNRTGASLRTVPRGVDRKTKDLAPEQ